MDIALGRRGEALARPGDSAQRRDTPRRGLGTCLRPRARVTRRDASSAEHAPGARRWRRRASRRLRPGRQRSRQNTLVRRSLLAPFEAGRRARCSAASWHVTRRLSSPPPKDSTRSASSSISTTPYGEGSSPRMALPASPSAMAQSGKPTSVSRSTYSRCARAGSSWQSSLRTTTPMHESRSNTTLTCVCHSPTSRSSSPTGRTSRQI